MMEITGRIMQYREQLPEKVIHYYLKIKVKFSVYHLVCNSFSFLYDKLFLFKPAALK